MSQVLTAEQIILDKPRGSWVSYAPAIFAIVGAFAMLGLRLEFGNRFISDEAFMLLALACYIFGALFQLTNL